MPHYYSSSSDSAELDYYRAASFNTTTSTSTQGSHTHTSHTVQKSKVLLEEAKDRLSKCFQRPHCPCSKCTSKARLFKISNKNWAASLHGATLPQPRHCSRSLPALEISTCNGRRPDQTSRIMVLQQYWEQPENFTTQTDTNGKGHRRVFSIYKCNNRLRFLWLDFREHNYKIDHNISPPSLTYRPSKLSHRTPLQRSTLLRGIQSNQRPQHNQRKPGTFISQPHRQQPFPHKSQTPPERSQLPKTGSIHRHLNMIRTSTWPAVAMLKGSLCRTQISSHDFGCA